MKKNIIEFLEESIHEKKLSHAFLIETSNYENLVEKIYETLKKNQILNNVKLENNNNVIVIKPDNNIIDKTKILELQEKFLTKTFDNTYKVYFIINAEKMNLSSNNKLLKFLEEPAANTLGFLLTEDIDLIIPTIRSRCTLFYSQKEYKISDNLKEEAQRILEMYNTSTCDIMLLLKKFKSYDRNDLIDIINEIINNLYDSKLDQKKVNTILQLKKCIDMLNNHVNLELILDKISIELGN